MNLSHLLIVFRARLCHGLTIQEIKTVNPLKTRLKVLAEHRIISKVHFRQILGLLECLQYFDFTADGIMRNVDWNEFGKAHGKGWQFVDLIMGKIQRLKIGHGRGLNHSDKIVAEVKQLQANQMF